MEKFTCVYSATDESEVAFIKSLLDNTDIAYYITNDNPNSLYASRLFYRAHDVMVSPDQAAEVKEILKDLIGPTRDMA
jgi:hypothetical protein